MQKTYPSFHQWALDTLSCPTTACEFERDFGSAKTLISPERTNPGDDTTKDWLAGVLKTLSLHR